MSKPNQGYVRRRRVLYIPGYDPLPPRRYRELYRTEGAAQAEISGYQLTLARPPQNMSGFGWIVDTRIDGREVQTEFEVLSWSDLVRLSFEGSVLRTYGALIRTAQIYIGSGALWRLARLRKGPVLAAFYPVAMLLGQLAVALAAGWLTFRFGLNLISSTWGEALVWMASAVSVAVSLLLVSGLLRFFKSRDGRFFAHYLMHDFSYSSALSGAYTAALEERLAAFCKRVEAALESDVDEVLVVGHSSGAHLSVSVLSDMLRQRTMSGEGPALALLTLGQVVPMMSFLPNATRLRADLRFLSKHPLVTWVDVTAPGDGCCFALCDPVAVSGQATPAKRGPLVFSAAFSQTLSPARRRSMRWRFFRLHFQYLCAFDRPKDYDYFQITAGPLRLSDRYAGRPASKSRLETSATGYTSTVA